MVRKLCWVATEAALSLPLTFANEQSWFVEQKVRKMTLMEHIKCWWEYRK